MGVFVDRQHTNNLRRALNSLAAPGSVADIAPVYELKAETELAPTQIPTFGNGSDTCRWTCSDTWNEKKALDAS